MMIASLIRGFYDYNREKKGKNTSGKRSNIIIGAERGAHGIRQVSSSPLMLRDERGVEGGKLRPAQEDAREEGE